jgi:hypothetical protein
MHCHGLYSVKLLSIGWLDEFLLSIINENTLGNRPSIHVAATVPPMAAMPVAQHSHPPWEQMAMVIVPMVMISSGQGAVLAESF